VRILAVRPGPAFSVADVHDGWVAGLREAGAEVVDYNHDARVEFYCRVALEKQPGEFALALDPERSLIFALNDLHAVCYQYRPDVVFITSGFYLRDTYLDVIRSYRTRVVLLHTESPYQDDDQIVRAAKVDLNLINDPTNLEQFRAVAPTFYVPHAYRPDRHFPRQGMSEHASDFCFVGTGYPSRTGFFEAVDFAGIDVALAGNWQWTDEESPLRKWLAHDVEVCCDNEQTAYLYAATKMSANLYRREANRPALSAGWAMSPREVELAAMGVPFLRDPRGESDAVLPMLPTFDGPAEFGERLRWWLAHDDARHQAGCQAREAVADRTFVSHARQLLRLLDDSTREVI
jgi:hypothetical protein